MPAVKTQGTQLYVIDPADDSVITITCVTSLSGLTSPIDQIETTCLDSDAREYVAGMATPGQAQFGINFDPQDESHLRLLAMKNEGLTLDFAIGFSDGTAAPTVDSGGFVLPTSRSYLTFDGFLTDLPFDFSLNAVVTSTASIQVSGAVVLSPKTT